MKLRVYLAEQEMTATDFARIVGCSVQTVTQTMHGRDPSPSMARRFVQASGGRVSFNDLYDRTPKPSQAVQP